VHSSIEETITKCNCGIVINLAPKFFGHPLIFGDYGVASSEATHLGSADIEKADYVQGQLPSTR